MGNIPLPALAIRPPDIEPYQKLRANALGQQIGQEDLQGKKLENQKSQSILQGNQALLAAQHDPDFNPDDPDNVMRHLKKYGVPLQLQGLAMKAIGDMKSSIQSQTKEDLAASAQVHSFFDDQFQGAKSAPLESREKTYQQAIANARNFVSRFPNGPAKQQAMAEVNSAPPIYDENWINSQHGLLKTQAALIEEALKKSQTAEAAGKGEQATAAGQLDLAKIPGAVAEGNLTAARIPGEQAKSAIDVQQAGMTPQGRSLAGNLFYGAAGGDPQAKRALNFETQQKIAAAQAGVANVPAGLRGVAPHLVAPAAADATKYGQEYADATAAANDMKTFVDMAKGGNKIAYAYSPTEGVLTLNTARGVKRVNMAEISSYGGAGSALDRITGFLGKQASGASIPQSVLNDMESLHQAIAGNARNTYANKLKNVNSTYGSHFEPVDMGGPNAGSSDTGNHPFAAQFGGTVRK